MTTTRSTKTTWAAAALLVPASLMLAACAGTSSAPTDSTTVSSASTSSTTDNGLASTSTATIDVALPAGVEPGSDAALAWDALMGPDGEYAAAASYAAVIDEFGDVEPYVTIKAAEERHIDALIRQLDRYGVDVPDNPYLGNLEAPADLQSAASAWAVGEVANVELYDVLLEQTDDANLTRVFTNLRRASLESHLPTFEAAAAAGGTLTAEDMAAMPHSGEGGGGRGGNGGGGGVPL